MIPNDYKSFQETMDFPKPNTEWPEALQALWWDAKGNWNASHNIAQDLHTPMGSWIHAYLHRKEGDKWNAGYWYRQAGRSFPECSLEKELEQMVEHVLNQ
ncbi:hypothetical protein [Flagellimonas sp.]|uniref:hypothetical protein n=1 Tax=Flagellimonas sp. TaxID=2058762 RepID=UPI003B50FD35